MNRSIAIWGLILALVSDPAHAEQPPAISAQELLAPAMFPEAQMGMRVEKAEDGEAARIVTLGAEFIINKASGTIECRQRIAAQRTVATLSFPRGSLSKLKLSHSTDGAAILSSPQATVRVNGDSLLMIQLADGGTIKASLGFTPDFFNQFHGSFNFFDPVGGISFFDNGFAPPCQFSVMRDPVTVTWTFKPGEVLWASVSPPREFDWQKSVSMRVAVHGSSVDRYMYPSDIMIHRLKSQGATVLYLHNEEAWEHWQLSLIPRNRAEYQRVMRTARELGLKTIVYASPHFFLEGTEEAARADKSSAVGRGTFSGHNAREYLKQATRIVKEFETDGLYFDEIYSNPAALATQYWLARESRKLVGDGPLFYHSTTDALGDGHTGLICAPLNTYFDVVYKGEGEWTRFEPAYTRYILGTFNTSNAIGVQINDERFVPTADQIDYWLRRANIRFFLLEYMNHNGANQSLIHSYLPRLSPGLRSEIEPGLLKPVGSLQEFRQSVMELGK